MGRCLPKAKVDVRMDGEAFGVSPKWAADVISKTLTLEKSKRSQVGLYVTNNKNIRRINRAYLKHDRVTDVISFWLPKSALGPTESSYLGEIVVSAQMAKAQAKRFGIEYKAEFARYLVHGVLHLLGHTDIKKSEKEKMSRRQERILSYLMKGVKHV